MEFSAPSFCFVIVVPLQGYDERRVGCRLRQHNRLFCLDALCYFRCWQRIFSNGGHQSRTITAGRVVRGLGYRSETEVRWRRLRLYPIPTRLSASKEIVDGSGTLVGVVAVQTTHTLSGLSAAKLVSPVSS